MVQLCATKRYERCEVDNPNVRNLNDFGQMLKTEPLGNGTLMKMSEIRTFGFWTVTEVVKLVYLLLLLELKSFLTIVKKLKLFFGQQKFQY